MVLAVTLGLLRLRRVTRRRVVVRRLRLTGFFRRTRVRLFLLVLRRFLRRGFTSRISLILSILYSCFGKFILPADNVKGLAV